MSKLVECVPNFSEGKDKNKVDAIVAAAKSIDGVRVLDIEMDADHNRCVLTFVAPPAAAVEAAYKAATKAKELIDLTVHKGEHPRMGATDVIPFIPVSDVSVAECVELAKQLGPRIAKDLGIPVYLYGLAAQRPERKDLAVVRKGQFEGLKTAIETDPTRAPDFGAAKIHPTAGAVAVGAREQIINFNVNLDTTDLEAGKTIAKKIRASGGGLPELRAKEIVMAAAGNRIQISTVLTDYRKTSIATVMAAVEAEAKAHNAKIVSTEIVGLVPRDAILNFAVDEMKVQNFNLKTQVLENHLGGMWVGWQEAVGIFVDALANTSATPGGGSGAGVAGAMGCALGQMAVGISIQSKKIDPGAKKTLEWGLKELGEFRAEMMKLTADDAAAFDKFMDVAKLPKDNPERGVKMQEALRHAAEVPLMTAKQAAKARRLLMDMVPLALGSVASDMQCAAHLLRAAAQCAAENVRINLLSIKDPETVHNIERRLSDAIASM